MKMQVEEDFTSGKLTLAFEEGKRVDLTKAESKEFEKWFNEKRKQ